ncbi:hypothetical protein HanRHA438_Chr10g0446291 [Helianthus annuus]|nr:hypothetical protein HanRHA438_Chr10g0446291 [Helianthus annuus]
MQKKVLEVQRHFMVNLPAKHFDVLHMIPVAEAEIFSYGVFFLWIPRFIVTRSQTFGSVRI